VLQTRIIPGDDRDATQAGDEFLKQLQPLFDQFAAAQGDASDIAARPSQAVDDAEGYGITNSDQDDWYPHGRVPCSDRRGRSDSDGDVHSGADQFLRDAGQLIRALLGPAVQDLEIVTVSPAEGSKTVAEHIHEPLVRLPRTGPYDTNARDLSS
jgi:hypothetical protein